MYFSTKFVLLFCAFAMCTAKKVSFNTRTMSFPRIIGGSEVKDRKEFAYQVSITYKGNHTCGGTIISNRDILTAAHCFENVAINDIGIEAGHLNLKDENRKKLNILRYSIHDRYETITVGDSQYAINDLAMVTTVEDIPLDDYVNVLTVSTTKPSDNTRCVVSGWGITLPSAVEASEKLMKADVPIINQQSCDSIYGDFENATNGAFCAGYSSGQEDFCSGDSGGPLKCDDKLAGIVSWGTCGQVGFPGVYVDVSQYSQWIEDHKSASFLTNANMFLIILASFSYFL